MPQTQCCVPQCVQRGGFKFPGAARADIRRLWVIAIKRMDSHTHRVWEPSSSSLVCRDHFVEDDFVQLAYYGGQPQARRLKKNAVPSVFPWTKEKTESSLARDQRLQDRVAKQAQIDEDQSCNIASNLLIDEVPEIGETMEIDECDSVEPPKTIAVGSQTNTSGVVLTCDGTTDPMTKMPLSVSTYMDDPAGIHDFTGLENFDKFKLVLASLGPAAHQLTYMYGPIPDRISVEDIFFLVLIKLRKHRTNFELSRSFHISPSDVYNIFCTWVRFMSLQWQEVCIWTQQDVTRFFAPAGFKKDFPTTRVIVDGTECPVKKPKLPTAQQSTFSTYKNRNTAKVLVGITPGGMCSYVSPAYGGSTSDRQIVERSSMPQSCDTGDSVMSDKGFDVQDIFAPYNVTVNIPTFFKKQNRMSGKTVMRDRKIASKRVHVERFIGLAKTYTILSQPMNTSETQLSSDIIFVCFMLCNFRAGIVSKHA